MGSICGRLSNDQNTPVLDPKPTLGFLDVIPAAITEGSSLFLKASGCNSFRLYSPGLAKPSI
jgi:hypothetical protein